MESQKAQKQKRSYTLSSSGNSETIEYPIEHSYVDLNWLVIGEKMRAIMDESRLNKMRFDHLFYAEMILRQYDELGIFRLQNIQKIIDF